MGAFDDLPDAGPFDDLPDEVDASVDAREANRFAVMGGQNAGDNVAAGKRAKAASAGLDLATSSYEDQVAGGIFEQPTAKPQPLAKTMAEREGQSYYGDPVLSDKFLSDFREEVLAGVHPEDRMDVLRTIRDNYPDQAYSRAADVLLRTAERENRGISWQDEQNARGLKMPKPKFGGGGAAPMTPIPSVEPSFDDLYDATPKADIAERRMVAGKLRDAEQTARLKTAEELDRGELDYNAANLKIALGQFGSVFDGLRLASLNAQRQRALEAGEQPEVLAQYDEQLAERMSSIDQRSAEQAQILLKEARPQTRQLMVEIAQLPEGERWGAIGRLLLNDPQNFFVLAHDLGIQSLPLSLAIGAAGTLAAVAVPGAGIAGPAVATWATSAIAEFGGQYVENLRKGLTHDDAFNKAAARAGVVGAFDAASVAAAANAVNTVLKGAGFLSRAGRLVKEVPKQAGIQATLGGGGSALGSFAAGEAPDPTDVTAEMLGEIAPGNMISEAVPGMVLSRQQRAEIEARQAAERAGATREQALGRFSDVFGGQPPSGAGAPPTGPSGGPGGPVTPEWDVGLGLTERQLARNVDAFILTGAERAARAQEDATIMDPNTTVDDAVAAVAQSADRQSAAMAGENVEIAAWQQKRAADMAAAVPAAGAAGAEFAAPSWTPPEPKMAGEPMRAPAPEGAGIAGYDADGNPIIDDQPFLRHADGKFASPEDIAQPAPEGARAPTEGARAPTVTVMQRAIDRIGEKRFSAAVEAKLADMGELSPEERAAEIEGVARDVVEGAYDEAGTAPAPAAKWDFINTFPEPNPESRYAQDYQPGNPAAIRAMHVAIGKGWISDAASAVSLSADLKTTQYATDEKERAKAEAELARVQQSMADTRAEYEQAFGTEAAEGFFSKLAGIVDKRTGSKLQERMTRDREFSDARARWSAEARAYADEILKIANEWEQYKPEMATSVKSFVMQSKRAPTAENVAFQRKLLNAEIARRAEAGKTDVKVEKEEINVAHFYRDDKQQLLKLKLLRDSSDKEAVDVIAQADEVLQSLTSELNRLGYRFDDGQAGYADGKDEKSKRVKAIRSAMSSVGGGAWRFIKGWTSVKKGYKRAKAERPVKDLVELKQDIANARALLALAEKTPEGKIVAAPYEPVAAGKPVTKQAEPTGIAAALRGYEGEGNLTVNDLADAVEEADEPALRDALDTFRNEQADNEKLAGRGDMDSAEELFVSAVRAFVQQGAAPDQVVPITMGKEQFNEITDEWAALFADPDQKVDLSKVAREAGMMTPAEAKAKLEEWRKHAAGQQDAEGEHRDNSRWTVLSLFDYTGEWAKPWAEAGYNVIQFDIKDGQDVNDFSVEYFTENWDITDVYAIIAAPPCTDFASSGARWFAEKDADGRTAMSVELVKQALRTIEYFRPMVWAIENPVGRIESMSGLPKARLSFDPWNFGDPYTKKTLLWGRFNADLPVAPVEPVEGSKMWARYGGKSEATKAARSVTPEGFSYAFFMANNYNDYPVADRLAMQYPEASGAVRAALEAGVREERIHDLMYDTYGNYEYEEARKALEEEVKATKWAKNAVSVPKKITKPTLTTIHPDRVPDVVNAESLDSDPRNTLVLIACSDKKTLPDGKVTGRAIDVYDGPMWQTLRAHRGNISENNIKILSAKHAWINPWRMIEKYNVLLSKPVADKLISGGVVAQDLWDMVARQEPGPNGWTMRPYRQVIIAGTGDYARVFKAAVAQLQEGGAIAPDAKIVSVSRPGAGIGSQRGNLGDFLRQANEEPKDRPVVERNEDENGVPFVPPSKNSAEDYRLAYELGMSRGDIAGALRNGYTAEQLRTLIQRSGEDAKKNIAIAGEWRYDRSAQGYKDQVARTKAVEALMVREGEQPPPPKGKKAKPAKPDAASRYEAIKGQRYKTKLDAKATLKKNKLGFTHKLRNLGAGGWAIVPKSTAADAEPVTVGDQNRNDIINGLIEAGGISTLIKADITGSRTTTAGIKVGLFRNAGMMEDGLAEWLQQRGFLLTENTAEAMQIVRDAIAGEPILTVRQKDEEADRLVREHAASLGATPEQVAEFAAEANPETSPQERQSGFDAFVYLKERGFTDAEIEDIAERAALRSENEEMDYEEAVIDEADKQRPQGGRGGEAAGAAVVEDREAAAQAEDLAGPVGETPAQRAIRLEQLRRDEERRRQEAEAPPPGEFQIAGSPRAADEAAARGQQELPATDPAAVMAQGLRELAAKIEGAIAPAPAAEPAAAPERPADATKNKPYEGELRVGDSLAVQAPGWDYVKVGQIVAINGDRIEWKPNGVRAKPISITRWNVEANITVALGRDERKYPEDEGPGEDEGDIGLFDRTAAAAVAHTSPAVVESHLPPQYVQLSAAYRAYSEGRISADELAKTVDLVLTKRLTAPVRPRQRGADMIREKLIRARRQGVLTEDEVGVALWLLDQAPQLAEDLGLSIKQAPKNESAAGVYRVLGRIIVLFRDQSGEDTATHEILHHTERMMPAEVQQGIRDEWLADLRKAVARAKQILKAKEEYGGLAGWTKISKFTDPEKKLPLLDWLLEAAEKGDEKMVYAIWLGFGNERISLGDVLPYKYATPSEYWAVNGSRIMRQRYEAQGSWVERARQWIRELIERVKGAIGLRSDAAVLRGLRAVMAGDGSFVTDTMVARGVLDPRSADFTETKKASRKYVGLAVSMTRELDDQQMKAVVDRILARPDSTRVARNLANLAGTPWAEAAIDGILLRVAMDDLMAGREPSVSSMMDEPSAGPMREALARGPEGAWAYLGRTGVLGHADKPVNSVASSYVNCSPTPECSVTCYATTGRGAMGTTMRKAELIEWAAESNPRRLGEQIAAEYMMTPEFATQAALRFFDRGDGADTWLPVIEAFNSYRTPNSTFPARAQIFSKNPAFLRKVNPMNLRLLSIDHSNFEVATENKDLPVAMTWRGQIDNAALEQLKGQVQVVLPIKIGDRVLEDSEIATLPAWARPYACPVGRKVGTEKKPLIIGKNIFSLNAQGQMVLTIQKGEWNCTRCDRQGGVGCFHKTTTTKAVAAWLKPINTRPTNEIDDLAERIRAAAAGLGDRERAELLGSLDRVLSVARRGIDPSSAGTGRSGDASELGLDDVARFEGEGGRLVDENGERNRPGAVRRSLESRGPARRLTKKEAGDRIAKLIGEKATYQLLRDGEQRKAGGLILADTMREAVEIYARSNDLPMDHPLVLDLLADENSVGFYDPASKLSFVLLDATDKPEAVALHERGVHAWTANVPAEKRNALISRAARLVEAGDDEVSLAARQRMRSQSIWIGQGDEAWAYLAEEAAKARAAGKTLSAKVAQWLEDVIAAIRAALYEAGIFIKADDLTAADLAAIARANLGSKLRAARSSIPDRARRGYAGMSAAENDARIKANLEVAYEMATKGVPNEKIRLATGWHRNKYDGKWRFEFSDESAEMTAAFDSLEESPILMGEPEFLPLSAVLNHDKLFELYPAARNIKVIKRKALFDFFGATQGWFDGKNTITITPYATEKTSTLMHEIQHWIQRQEGFAKGGNPEEALNRVAAEKLRELAGEALGKVEAQITEAEATIKLMERAASYPDMMDHRRAGWVFNEAFRQFDAAKALHGEGSTEARPAREAMLDAYAKKREADRAYYEYIADRKLPDGYLDMTSAEQGAAIAIVGTEDPQRRIKMERESLDKLRAQAAALVGGGRKELEKALRESGEGFKVYRQIAGEIEARDVQARMKMTPEERLNTPPLSSQPVEDPAMVTIHFYDETSASAARDYRKAARDFIAAQGENEQRIWDSVDLVYEYFIDDRSHGDEYAAEAAREIYRQRGGEAYGRTADIVDFTEAVLRRADEMRDEDFAGGAQSRLSDANGIRRIDEILADPALLRKAAETWTNMGQPSEAEIESTRGQLLAWRRVMLTDPGYQSEQLNRVLGDVPQSISSAATTRKQVPAAMKKIPWKRGVINLDIGAGRFNDATEYLAGLGVINLEFDPFNRAPLDNYEAISLVANGSGADSVTVMNVLNVIPDAAARDNVVRRAAKALSDGGVAYFQMYEGDGSGVGAPSRDGWQENRKTESYVAEIERYFGSVERKGQLIEARKPIRRAGDTWEATGGDIMFSRDNVGRRRNDAGNPPGVRRASFTLGGEGNVSAFDLSETASHAQALRELRDSLLGAQRPVVSNRGIDIREVRERVDAYLTNHLKFNWLDRNILTDYHKAQKNAAYGAIFYGVQDFIDDTAAFANNAADRAPDILPKMKHIGDAFRIGAGNKDIDAASRLLFDATIEDRVYSLEEARADGYTEKQFELYKQMRSAINASLDTLASSEMYRLALTVNRPLPDVRYMSPQQASDAIRSYLDQSRAFAIEADDTKTVAKIEAVYQAIDDVLKRNRKLKREGYAPLMRFGKHAVSFKLDGEEGFLMFEAQGQRNLIARQLRQLGAEEVNELTIDPERFKLFRGIDPNALQLFSETAEIETMDEDGNVVTLKLQDNPLFQQYLRQAVANRSALKRLIHRKKMFGFAEDGRRVLAAFVTSNARLASRNHHMMHLFRGVQRLEMSPAGDVAEEARKLLQFVQEPQENNWAAGARSAMFMYYLGGNIASALINLTQPGMVTLPVLSRWGIGRAVAEITRAAKDAVGRPPGGQLGADLAKASAEGVVEPHELHNLYSQAGNRLQVGRLPVQRMAKRAALVWGSLFSAAEAFNRRNAFIAAWRIADTLTPEQMFRDYKVRTKYDFAVKVVRETQFLYNKGNRIPWARNPIGAVVLTFKQYQVMWLETFARLPMKQKLQMLGILLLVSGLQGLPFADDLDDLLDSLLQALGKDWNTEEKKRELIEDVLRDLSAAVGHDMDPTTPKQLARIAMYGLSAVPGVPFDIQGRLGMGNLIPGTGIFKASEGDKSRQYLEFLGPAATMVRKGAEAVTETLAGNLAGAGKLAAPVAVQNFLQAVDMAVTGAYRDIRKAKVVDIGPADVVSKAIGYQPQKVAERNRVVRAVEEEKTHLRVVEDRIARKIADGLMLDDQNQVDDALQELDRWNRNNPDAPIVITAQQIKARVRSMSMDRAERSVRTAPREIRGRVAEQLGE